MDAPLFARVWVENENGARTYIRRLFGGTRTGTFTTAGTRTGIFMIGDWQRRWELGQAQ